MRVLAAGALSIALFAGCFFVGFAAVGGFAAAEDRPALPPVETDLPDHLPRSERLDALIAKLERAQQEELRNGCVRNNGPGGRPVFCGASRDRLDTIHREISEEIDRLQRPDDAAYQEAIRNIRIAVGDPQAEVTFEGSGGNPYTATRRLWEEYRVPEANMIFFVDAPTRLIAHMQPILDSKVAVTDQQLSETELQAIAEAFLARVVPNFERVREEYDFRVKSKKGRHKNYFLRWERHEALEGEPVKPFVQVTVAQDGTIPTFTNTLPLYGITD